MDLETRKPKFSTPSQVAGLRYISTPSVTIRRELGAWEAPGDVKAIRFAVKKKHAANSTSFFGANCDTVPLLQLSTLSPSIREELYESAWLLSAQVLGTIVFSTIRKTVQWTFVCCQLRCFPSCVHNSLGLLPKSNCLPHHSWALALDTQLLEMLRNHGLDGCEVPVCWKVTQNLDLDCWRSARPTVERGKHFLISKRFNDCLVSIFSFFFFFFIRFNFFHFFSFFFQ